MESRWYKLTAAAYLRGVLDYPAAPDRDWRWHMKEDLVLQAIEDDLVTSMNDLSHRWHCAAAQVTGWDEKEELFNYHKRQASFAYNIIGRATLPWYKSWKESEVSLGELWKRFKAMEKDPVFSKRLKKLHEDIRIERVEREQNEQAMKDSLKRFKEMKKKQELVAKQRRERANRVLRNAR